jgi:hypothetical protein
LQDAGVQALAGALHHLPQLRTLNLGCALATARARAHRVRTRCSARACLCCQSDSGRHFCVLYLSLLARRAPRGLFSSPSPRCSQNRLGDAGAQALARGLCHLSQLRTLSLEHNHICTDGVKALARTVRHLSQLKALNL